MRAYSNVNPCSYCPWRKENQGKRTPGGWYTKKNLQRLWAGLRRGERMSCHPTDPRMNHEEHVCPKGYKPAQDGNTPKECMGGLILQQREVTLAQELENPNSYFKERPQGMTRRGIGRFIERAVFGDAIGPMPRPNIADKSIYYEPLK